MWAVFAVLSTAAVAIASNHGVHMYFSNFFEAKSLGQEGVTMSHLQVPLPPQHKAKHRHVLAFKRVSLSCLSFLGKSLGRE